MRVTDWQYAGRQAWTVAGSIRAKIAGELMFRGARLLATTITVHSEGQDAVVAFKRERRPIVFVGWHGHDAIHLTAYRILFGPSAPAVIMVLDDVKGRVLEHFGRRLKLRVISLGHDPESPQWARGVVKMIALLRSGYDAMVAADGPHGPPLEAKVGAALIAQRARGVIVPSMAACTRQMVLRHRWDNHLVPLPFSRIVVHFGTPIDALPALGPEPPLDDLRARIQAALDLGTERAAVPVDASIWSPSSPSIRRGRATDSAGNSAPFDDPAASASWFRPR